MKKFLNLCIATVLLCVGCSDNTKKETESNSDIEVSAAADNFDGEQKNVSETSTTSTAVITDSDAEKNTVKTTEMPIDEKEFIITEKNEEKINTPVSTKPNIESDHSIVSTADLLTSAADTTAKTYTTTVVNTTVRIPTTIVTQMPEKQPETTAAETKSGIIELPFVPIR